MAQRPGRNSRSSPHPAMTYTPPKKLRQFQKGMAILVSTLLVIGLWTGGWFMAETWINGLIKDWIAAKKSQGVSVSYAGLNLSGYPSRILINITAPQFSGSVFGQDISWRGERLVISTRPWMPWKWHIDASGNHDLSFESLALNLSGTIKKLGIDLVTGTDLPETLSASVTGLKLDANTPGDGLYANKFKVFYDGNSVATGIRIAGNGENLILPKRLNLPLGNRVQNFDLAFQINGPFDLNKLQTTTGPALTAWQQGGGGINIQRLKLRNGPLGLTTAGLLSLTDDLQPQGNFTAKIEGLFKILELMRLKGYVKGTDSVIATMALSALSKRPKDGGASFINLSIKVDQGQLKLGPIPVYTMPHFKWGIPAHIKPKPVPRNYKDIAPVY